MCAYAVVVPTVELVRESGVSIDDGASLERLLVDGVLALIVDERDLDLGGFLAPSIPTAKMGSGSSAVLPSESRARVAPMPAHTCRSSPEDLSWTWLYMLR